MQEVLLVVHLMLAIAIVVLVLLQRSEGGALGIGGGGGGGGGGFMTGRDAANLLTRLTAGFAALFMVTSLALTIIAQPEGQGSILDKVEQEAPAANQPKEPAKPSVPISD
jgi:preprotein translocase subunit SecG